MPEYKATVIIPVYNVEKFVESCLASLTEQTIGFENIEVLLVNPVRKKRTIGNLFLLITYRSTL